MMKNYSISLYKEVVNTHDNKNNFKKGSEQNYNLFRKLYMRTNDKGQWEQIPEMWKKSDDGVTVPKTREEAFPVNISD